MHRIISFAAVLVVALATALSASAAPGQGWAVSLDQASPVFGSQVTFTVTEGKYVGGQYVSESPWVRNECYQAGSLVYAQWHGYFPGYYAYPGNEFTLGPTQKWQGGAAECVATVGYFRNGVFQDRASTEYGVGG